MKVLLFILKKEFRQIRRNKSILLMMFMMPVVQLIILPLAMDFDVKSVNLVVVDNDHSSTSQKLISAVVSSGYFVMKGEPASYKEALGYIEEGSADIILEIPPSFDKMLVRESRQPVAIYADAINGTKAAIGSSYLTGIIKSYNNDLNIHRHGIQPSIGNIDITYTNWFNPLGIYKYNVVPAVLVLLLTLIGGYITALNIVREKEIGTIEQINVTPVKKWQFIIGKLTPFWIIGMTVFSIGLLVSALVYGITPKGSLGILYAFAMVYLVAIMGFGLLISTYSDNQVQAMFVAFFFMMIFMLMSGFFTSTDSMPGWAKVISELTPVTHFIKTDRMIILKASEWKDVQKEFLYLVGFAVFLNGWAIWNYRKTS